MNEKIEDIYPLTSTQEGMLFHSLQCPNTGIYCEIFAIEIDGLLMKEFRKAWELTVEEHSILRTSFFWKDIARPLQAVHRNVDVPFNLHDRSDLPHDIQKKTFSDLTKKIQKEGFLLSHAPLMRIELVNLGNDKYHFIWCYHHILLDGWSAFLIIEDVLKKYDVLCNGQNIELKKKPNFKNFVNWLFEQNIEESRHFWQTYLAGVENCKALSFGDKKEDWSHREHSYETVKVDLTASEYLKLRSMLREQHLMLNPVLQAALGYVISLFTNESKSLFATTVSGRPAELDNVNDMVGLFINTIPVCIDVSKKDLLKNWIKSIQETNITLKNHEHVSLIEILKCGGIHRPDSVMNVLLAVETFPKLSLEDHFDRISDVRVSQITNYPLSIAVEPSDNLHISFIYDVKIFSQSDISLFGELFLRFLKCMSTFDPNADTIEVLHTKIITGYESVIKGNEGTSNTWSIRDRLSEIASKYPERTAISDSQKSMTYKEFDSSTDQIAVYLRKQRILENDIVGVCMERSVQCIENIVGVIKNGSTYLPIDPSVPEERITEVVANSRAKSLIVNSDLLSKYSFTTISGIRNNSLPKIVTNPRAQIMEANEIPVPDRSYIDHGKYHKYIGHASVKHCVAVQVSRGCPFKCAYCHRIWPKKTVTRNIDKVFEEIRQCYDAGIKRFAIIDDIFNLDKKNSGRLLEKIIAGSMKLNIFFPNGLRGDILSPDFIDLMFEAGTVNMALALESASPRIQESIGKKLHIDKLERNIQYITNKYPQLLLDLFLMIGFPGETEHDAELTYSFLARQQWIHFPYLHILKIFKNTDMYSLALANGITPDQIERSAGMAYHELPETLPFSSKFVEQFKARYMNEYFLNKERLLHVLTAQMQVMTEDEIVQKYNSYLPGDINSLDDLFNYIGIPRTEFTFNKVLQERDIVPENFQEKINLSFKRKSPDADSVSVLLLDLSLHFSNVEAELYDVVEAPLGLLTLMTYLDKKFGNKVNGTIAKSRIDFDSFNDLKDLILKSKPDVIGIRTLSYYKEFFHEVIAMIRMWGFDVPILAGGPYATSDYELLLNDTNVACAVLGEGEHTFAEIISKMLGNSRKFPSYEELANIDGIAFIDRNKIEADKLYTGPQIINTDHLEPEICSASGSLSALIEGSDHVFYVISTSGSTGTPKSAGVFRKSFENLCAWFGTDFNFSDRDKLLLTNSLSFDLTQKDIFTPLLFGGELVVLDSVPFNPQKVCQIASDKKISWINCTPSMALSFIEWAERRNFEELSTIRYLFLGGEQIVLKKFKPFLSSKAIAVEIVNTYGPTECTDVVSFYRINKENLEKCEDHVPIGEPVWNAVLQIVNKSGLVVPKGVYGELVVKGLPVGCGYINNPQLTNAVFTADKGRYKLYRTGDLACLSHSNLLYYKERIDNQVKIRGFRIELQEIEKKIEDAFDGIKQAVVVTTTAEYGEKTLTAYVLLNKDTFASNKPYEIAPRKISSKIEQVLGQKLPSYMVPSRFFVAEEFPKTISGKVDRKALSDLKLSDVQQNDANVGKPRNIIEELICQLWKEVLNKENITLNDDFFELGGHSLFATQVFSRIPKLFGVQVPLRIVFEKSTIASLAQEIIKLRNVSTGGLSELINYGEKDYYPQSYSQQRLFFIHKFEENCWYYNVPFMINIKKHVDIRIFKKALEILHERHESLRTTFHEIDGALVQKILPQMPMDLVEINIDGVATEIKERLVSEKCAELTQKVFDLEQGPLVSYLYFRDEGSIRLFVVMHHIITDGISVVVFQNELEHICEKLTIASECNLPLKPVRYVDYCLWQQEESTSKVLESQIGYWKKKLAGVPDFLQLPTDYVRPPYKTYNGRYVRFNLGADLSSKLKQLAAKEKTTLYSVLSAGFNILLGRYSSQEDICVGTPMANRDREEIRGLIGFFINTVVIRSVFKGEDTAQLLIQQIKNNVLEAFEHSLVPFEMVVESLKPRRDLNHDPLFQIMFSVQDQFANVSNINGEKWLSKFDMNITLSDTCDGIVGGWEFCSDLFHKERIVRMIDHFKVILEQIVENPATKIADIVVITKEEYKIMVTNQNAPSDYAHGLCIHDLVDKWVKTSPNRTALRCRDTVLTYAELDALSDKVADHLLQTGSTKESAIAIYFPRGVENIVVMLGIAKAGCCYVPIDLNTPASRRTTCMSIGNVHAVITSEALREELSDCGRTVVAIEPLLSSAGEEPRTAQIPVCSPQNLLYKMFTSGSTGEPKGVSICHRNVVRLVDNNNFLHISQSDKILHFAPTAFDASTLEIWGALVNGAEIIIYPPEQPSLTELKKFVSDNGITILWLTAGLFHSMVDDDCLWLKNVRVLLAGGDVLSKEKVEKVYRLCPNTQIINGYGPTENTTFSCCHNVTEKSLHYKSIPIGKTISNSKTYILDKYLNPVGLGIPGELYLGGDGLSRGYSLRTRLTAEKFVPDRFGTDGSRLFAVGDIGMYSGYNCIEFLRRSDLQVKIRGFRIELDEIESFIQKRKEVRQVTVVAKEQNSEKYLVAFLVPHNPGSLNIDEIKTGLKLELPAYMIPQHFVVIDEFPLNENGKVDRKLLMQIDVVDAMSRKKEYCAPRNGIEEELVSIWEKMLDVERVGIHDDFFDLGGHSIIAAKLVSVINSSLCITVPLKKLFESPTIERLASYISSQILVTDTYSMTDKIEEGVI